MSRDSFIRYPYYYVINYHALTIWVPNVCKQLKAVKCTNNLANECEIVHDQLR
jgi:hypothetical protein